MHLTLDSEVAETLNGRGIIKHVVRVFTVTPLFKSLQLLTDDLAAPTPLLSGDLLKVILNLTLQFGPLSESPRQSTKKDLSQFKKYKGFSSSLTAERLCTLYRAILSSPKKEFHPLKEIVVSCLINVPEGGMSIISDDDFLDKLLDVLKEQLQSTEEYGIICYLLFKKKMIGHQLHLLQFSW